MLRILLVAYHFPPANNGGIQRPLQMSKLLPRSGVEVTVLTQRQTLHRSPGDPGVIRIYDTNSAGWGKLLHFPMRTLQRVSRRLGMSTSWHGLWSRMARRQWRYFDRARPDLILSTYPPIETLEVGLHLAKRLSVPFVADFRDGLMFEPVEPVMLRSASTRRRYRRIEHDVARHAAAILTVSEPISEYFRAEYDHAVVRTLPNGFDPDESWIEPQASELDRAKFNLVYTGRLGSSEKERQAPAFFDALAELARDIPDVANTLRVHFVGDFASAEQRQLSPLVEMGVARFHGFLPRARALGFQRAATLLLLVTGTGKTSVATSKLFEYLNAGRPILGLTHNTAAERIILETGAGFVVDPTDGDAVCSLMRRLLLEPGLLESTRRNEAEIAKYSRPHQMEAVAALLRAVAASHAVPAES